MFTPAADLIKPNGGDGSDQGEAGDHRHDQGQQVVAEGQHRQQQAGDRIDNADEQDVDAHGAQIAHALAQGVPHVARLQAADCHRRAVGPGMRAGGVGLKVGHSRTQLFQGVFERIADMVFCRHDQSPWA